MDRRWVVAVTVVIIVAVTLATGPRVGLLTVPDQRATDSLGEGNATVTVTSVPETLTLEYGRYGNDEYHLRVPDARVEVANLSGNPILNYNVAITNLTSGSSLHFLGEKGEGPLGLSYASTAFDPERIEQERYDARLKLVLRTNGTERLIYNESATVEVEG